MESVCCKKRAVISKTLNIDNRFPQNNNPIVQPMKTQIEAEKYDLTCTLYKITGLRHTNLHLSKSPSLINANKRRVHVREITTSEIA